VSAVVILIIILVVVLLSGGTTPEPIPPKPDDYDNIKIIAPFLINPDGTHLSPFSTQFIL